MKKRVYIEIGNVCNLACSFCPTLKRERRQMNEGEFRRVMDEVAPYASEIFFHLMGEPLLHPMLESFLAIAESYGVPVSITTNGFLLSKQGGILLRHSKIIKKVNISLQSYEANRERCSLASYLDECISFAKCATDVGIYAVFRLWNMDSETEKGRNSHNDEILARLHDTYPDEWQARYSGYRIGKNTFLECAEIFEWPSESEATPCDEGRCHGLLDQIGILADGTVVPCCLDSEGEIALGNIYAEHLTDILQGARAREMERAMRLGTFTEALCKSCTYARRFTIKN